MAKVKGGNELNSAIHAKDMALLAALLSDGADPNSLDEAGALPLCVAVANDSKASIKALLAKGARVDERDGNGRCALHYASCSDTGAAAVLLAAKARPDARARSDDRSAPLHFAVKYGIGAGGSHAFRRARICELMEAGADSGLLDAGGFSPLALAASLGQLECVVELLDFGADPDLPSDRTGETPLMIAARHGRESCVRELISGGAKVLAFDKDGWSALRHAAHSGSMGCCSALMDAGARHGERCVLGRTPVDEAANAGHAELAEWLASAKFSVDERAEIVAAAGLGSDAGEQPEPVRVRSKARL